MEPFDDPLAAQFATFREDTLSSIRPAGAAEARQLYEQRHRTRVLTVAVGIVAAAVVTAGGGFALSDRATGTLPADHRSVSPSPAASATPSATSAPPVGEAAGTSGAPSDTATAPLDVRITSVTAIGVNTLWAVGYVPCSGHAWGSCPTVLSSHDAGHHWTPVGAPGTAPYIGEIRFANNKDGWVVAQDGIGDHEPTDGWGVLYATHDGGATWREITTIHNITHVEAAAGEVWALAGAGALFTAPVGSNTFAKIRATEGDGLAVHGKNAYVYPTTWTPGQSNPPPLEVTHSDATATTSPLPCPADTTADVALTTVGDTSLVAVCGLTHDTGGQDKVAFASPDGGTTWTVLGKPDHGGLVTSVASCAAGTFLAGKGMSLRATRDGGASWPIVQAMPTEGGYRYVGFTDDKHGFALGGDGTPTGTRQISMTSDGGHTWNTYDVAS